MKSLKILILLSIGLISNKAFAQNFEIYSINNTNEETYGNCYNECYRDFSTLIRSKVKEMYGIELGEIEAISHRDNDDFITNCLKDCSLIYNNQM